VKRLGLYIHIPFCRSKCRYCDFCSLPHRTEADFEAYVNALCADLRFRAADCRDYRVDTVYFGGGTPTLLPWRLLEHMLKTVFDHYRVAENAEITSECNPKTGAAALLREMRRMVFNRLSIGLQSTRER
jgi:oxygen-independent coproporphyrinogen-3 oxidase